jgi:AcrR family transcriptional regulator
MKESGGGRSGRAESQAGRADTRRPDSRSGRPDSRTVLLAAAAGEFAKNGPKGTRVQDIVKAAGVNERMIYHHFESKDGLYRAVMQEQRMLLGMSWGPAVERAVVMEPLAGMRLLLDGLLAALQARPQVAALLIHEALGDAPLALPAEADGFIKPIRDLYDRGRADGVFPAAVPFETAYLVAVVSLLALSVLGGRAPDFMQQGLDGDPRPTREAVVTQVLNGMTG